MGQSHRIYLILYLAAAIPILTLHAQEIKVILENDKVRVTEYTAKPHEGVCGVGMHSHPAHLTVILQQAKVRVTLPGGKPVDKEPRKDLVFWSEAGTHSVENIDTVIRHALIIDIKEPAVEHKGK
ncbi:MAG TPA: hypothetical protein VES59_01640 [Bacteroidota bacterium]|nr:hypothetical protein [Bacteroidota bacterium]